MSLPRMAGLLLALAGGWNAFAASPSPTGERAGTLHVVLDRDYPPYSFRASDGRLQGILIDQWQLWEQQTGTHVEFHALDWAEAVARMRAGDFDVIDCIVETPARRAYFDFTPPSGAIDVPISFRKDISGLTDLASLRGFPVGVKAGDQHIDILRANGVATLIEFPNDEAVVEAARQRKVNVFLLDAPSALYYLNKAGLAGEFRQSAPLFRDQLRRAVRKGDGRTLRTVTDGYAALAPEDLARIDEKWFGRTINSYARYLILAGGVVVAALTLVAGLALWNRTLRSKVRQRTAALFESEQRFRQIAENIHDVLWLSTADLSQTLYVSPAYEKVWGRSRENLYQGQDAFLAAIHPEDRLRVAETLARAPERGFQVEYRIVRPDGAVRWIGDRAFPIENESGGVYRVTRIAEDITERKRVAEIEKQAEDRVRLLIDTMPTSAWSVQADGVVDFVNQRWLDYTGRSLAQELAEPMAPIHAEDLKRVLTDWREAMAAGRAFEAEMRMRRADGAYRWFLVRTVPLWDQGRIVKWFGASVDIEDRKQAEDSLHIQRGQLRALVKRLHTAREEEAKRIARELHDDLGQQLTALNLQIENLEFNLTDVASPQRAQFEAMHALVNRTIEGVQSIAGGLRLGQLDVLGLTAAIDWQLQEFSRRAAIPCEVTRLDEITDLSDAQNTAVFRILQEALTNVVRHARATRVHVSLQAAPDHVILKVRDNGRGITATELIDRRAIGLLGMHERAETVGGTVVISGEPGHGTTVLVTIPLKRAEHHSA